MACFFPYVKIGSQEMACVPFLSSICYSSASR